MKLFHQFLLTIIICFLVGCAKIGRPSGGPKDENAPIMVTAKPPYESTNFKEKSIRIYFDEFINLKNLNKQLIISPPLKNRPLITPQGSASKYINIKILDTLAKNTTYIFNFGNAVKDNNENNTLESFKYVFSTGKTIDSLTLQGSVNNALEGKLKKNISLLLYKLDSTYNDSVPLKKKPNYVTSTTDSVNFKFTNLKAGKYKLLAINEEFNDYIFEPTADEIGFFEQTIELPKDSILKNTISIFKETQPFKFKRGKEISKGKIKFWYTGNESDFDVKILGELPEDFKSFKKIRKESDTLDFWFTPKELDSLTFQVSNLEFKDTINVRFRKKKIDSLKVTPSITGILNIKDTLFLATNNPIAEIDTDKIELFEKDSITVEHQIKKININKLAVLFSQNPKSSYRLDVFPEAITDLYQSTNDTIKKRFVTKHPEDYGHIILDVKNTTPDKIIIELLENKKVIRRSHISVSGKVNFDNLPAKKYKIRAIIDTNQNGIWDTGNFLKKIQPERIIYLEEPISLRANWTVDNIFEIK